MDGIEMKSLGTFGFEDVIYYLKEEIKYLVKDGMVKDSTFNLRLKQIC